MSILEVLSASVRDELMSLLVRADDTVFGEGSESRLFSKIIDVIDSQDKRIAELEVRIRKLGERK